MTEHEFNPYVGPRPFERKEEDAARFFGRSQETEEIVSLIFGHPVILVYAQSGAGKTSLFNASVALKLEENGFDVLPLTRVGGIVPKGIALQDIKNLYIFNALLKIDPETDPQTLLSKSLSTYLKTPTETTAESDQPCPRVIIFDQFEELFTYTPKLWREQREGFFLQVVEALNADPLLRVVFVIREDFLAELDPYARNLPERLRTRYRLERLGANAALRAIKDPLANTPRSFAPGVAEGLVKELLVMKTVDATGKTAEIEGQYVEPVQLQVVCVTLWSSLEPDCIEIQQAHLKNFNVNDALANFYKAAVESAAKETGVSVADLRNWFGKTLITPMGTRSTVFRGEPSTGGIENSAVDFLESRHIIRAEFRAGARWYELTHDRLVEPILASNRKWLESLSPLQQRAAQWNDEGKPQRLLYSGQALLEADEWAKEHESELTEIEKEFLLACLTRQREEEERQKLIAEQMSSRRRRIVAYILTFAMIIMACLASFGIRQARLADANSQKAFAYAETAEAASTLAFANAENSRASEKFALVQAEIAFSNALMAQSNALQEKDLQTSILLGIEAYRNIQETDLQNVQATGTLLDAAQANPRLRQFLNRHSSAVAAVAFSPDGKTLASASDDKTIRFWDTKTGQPIGEPLSGHTDAVTSIAFSPNGKTLASGSSDTTIILWDAQAGQQIGQLLAGHSDEVSTVTFSPDGRILASSSDDGMIILWDANSLEMIGQLSGHTNAISSIAFSPDGNILASGSYDQTTILWDVNTLRPIGEPLTGSIDAVTSVAFSLSGNILAMGSCSERSGDNCLQGQVTLWDLNTREISAQMSGHADSITSVAFSPDGKTLASASFDTTIMLWDVKTGQSTGEPLTGHTDAVNSVAFSPDGRTLASGSSDTTVILWDLEKRQLIAQSLTGHTDAVLSIAFNSDNKTLASGSWDSTIIQWNVDTGQPIGQPLTGHTSAVSAVAFSPDGVTLASGSYDNTIMLWDGKTGQLTGQPLSGHTAAVTSIAFGSNGETVASGSSDTTIILWDAQTRQMIGQLIGHSDAVSAVTFSPDGRTLASASYDGTIRLWDTNSLEMIGQPLTGHSDAVSSIVFSPDGQTLASSSYDKTIILWDMATQQPIGQPLAGHTDAVASVAFSPDGKTLVSGGFDRTIILWDVESGQQIGQPLTGHTDAVTSVAFSPDSKALASASYDTTVMLWDLDLNSLIEKFCRRVGRNFTRAEWARYFAREAYRATCEQWPTEPVAIATPIATQVVEAPATNTPAVIAATATSPATPTIAVAGTAPALFRVVNVTEEDRLNIRAGPGIRYEIIGKVPQDATGIQITGDGVNADNTIWVPILYNGISGWVNSFYLSKQ